MKSQFLGIIFTLFLILNVATAQEMTIRLSADDSVKAVLFSPTEFDSIQANQLLVRKNLQKQSGVSRIFTGEKGSIYLEFFNGSALAVESLVDLKKLSTVFFERIPYTKFRNEVTYIIYTTEADFNELKKEATVAKLHEAFASWGEFYKINNSENLIAKVKWLTINEPTYLILENERSMAGIDWELIDYLDEEDPILERGPGYYFNENKKFDDSKMETIDPEELSCFLSDVLNIDADLLDYSEKSLKILDESLLWNSDNLDEFFLVYPLMLYVAEMLIKNTGSKWDMTTKHRFDVLKTSKGTDTELAYLTYDALNNDYGLMQIDWVYHNILYKIDEEKKWFFEKW